MQAKQGSFFLLIASRAEKLDGGIATAEEIAKRRILAGQWPLYANTPHKSEIKEGDSLIIYLAGPNAMCFMAEATAGRVTFKGERYSSDGDALTAPPVAFLSLREPRVFPHYVPIRGIKEQLTFVPQGTPKWGGVLQRGAKRIPKADAMVILRAAGI